MCFEVSYFLHNQYFPQKETKCSSSPSLPSNTPFIFSFKTIHWTFNPQARSPLTSQRLHLCSCQGLANLLCITTWWAWESSWLEREPGSKQHLIDMWWPGACLNKYTLVQLQRLESWHKVPIWYHSNLEADWLSPLLLPCKYGMYLKRSEENSFS